MIYCKIVPINRTDHKKNIQNYASHEDCKNQNYLGFWLTRMFYSGFG